MRKQFFSSLVLQFFSSFLVLSFLSSLVLKYSYAQMIAALQNVEKGEHFIVYYHNAPMEHAKEILTKAEAYYDNVTEELGITRFEGFWTWDARVKIYMYDDKASYTTQTKRASWSGGHVNVITHEIHAYINMDDFLDVILPHEIGHIVFREFIGFRRSLPLWVDEGVVSFLEKSQKADRMLLVKTVLEKTTYFVPLRELGTAVVGLGIMPDLFYAEAASVIEFLINRYGKEKFTELCQRIRDMREGQDWFLAFKETYGFRDIDEMNEKWVEFLRS